MDGRQVFNGQFNVHLVHRPLLPNYGEQRVAEQQMTVLDFDGQWIWAPIFMKQPANWLQSAPERTQINWNSIITYNHHPSPHLSICFPSQSSLSNKLISNRVPHFHTLYSTLCSWPRGNGFNSQWPSVCYFSLVLRLQKDSLTMVSSSPLWLTIKLIIILAQEWYWSRSGVIHLISPLLLSKK